MFGRMTHARAKKSLGQHFLTDAAAIRRIAAAVPEGARVLEIGPGRGALTEPLLARVSALALVEKDDALAARWRERAADEDKLAVWHADVLEALDEVVAAFRPEWIVGNLPYNISGPLSAALFAHRLPGGMALMYQREVAARILAAPGGRERGGLSVLARHFYRPERLLSLPPGAFSPPPKVHSAVVLLRPRPGEPACDYAALQRAVRQGFAHRRKTLANNFRGLMDAEDWAALGLDARLRPEQLEYAQWARLAAHLLSKDLSSRNPSSRGRG